MQEVFQAVCADRGHVRVDMAKLLQEQQQEPMDLVWVSYYWKQVGLAVSPGLGKED